MVSEKEWQQKVEERFLQGEEQKAGKSYQCLTKEDISLNSLKTKMELS